jgi:flagellar biosynthesis/type III secretory pathway chaperone
VAAADAFAALAREFELELLHLEQMRVLLEAERRELLAGGIARLDAITAERRVQAAALELYAARRAVLLAEQGFSADATGLAACAVAGGERGGALAVSWQRVAEAAGEVRELNEQNQTLMRMWLATLTDGAALPPAGTAATLPDEPTTLDQVLRTPFSGCTR